MKVSHRLCLDDVITGIFIEPPRNFKINIAQWLKLSFNKKLCYCRVTVQYAMIVNSCNDSRGMGVIKVSNSNSDNATI